MGHRKWRNFENQLPVKSRQRTTANLKSLKRYNSAADWSIWLKLGTEFNHVSADALQMF